MVLRLSTECFRLSMSSSRYFNLIATAISIPATNRFTPVQYATESIVYDPTSCPTIGGPTNAKTELIAHIMPVQAPRESARSVGRIKATPDAGRPKREPPRTPKRIQKTRAWLSSWASGHRGKTTSAAPKQLTACTMAGLDHLGYINICFSRGGRVIPCARDGGTAQASDGAASIEGQMNDSHYLNK